MSAEQKPICVVIDTNIWIKESNLLLRTTMGSALLYILKKSNGKIGLPEIIEEELTRHTVKTGLKAVESINKNFKIIEVIMAFRSFYELPDKNTLETTVRERLAELDDLIIRIPFTFDHAKSALKRINEKSQPNAEKDQQFKDSAIWEAILTLLDSYTIHFISEDKAFFHKREINTNKLASNLLDDCQKIGGSVHIYKDMTSCLKVLQESIPKIDYSSLIVKIDSFINHRLSRELVAEVGFEIVGLAAEISSVSAFFIEINGKLALSFELHYYCKDVQNTDNDERKEAILRTKGDCLYEFDTETFSALQMDFERIYWVEPSGELGRRGVVYGSAFLGNNDRVNYTFKEPVDFIRYPGLNRNERVQRVRQEGRIFFEQYSEEARAVLEILLDKYAEEGIEALEIPTSIINHPEFQRHGDIIQIFELFGSEENLSKAVRQIQQLLYPS